MAHVMSGQQKRGGGGKDFTRQQRRKSGKSKKKNAGSQPKGNKYAKLIGNTKAKHGRPDRDISQACHCQGHGTCTYCVAERRRHEARKETARIRSDFDRARERPRAETLLAALGQPVPAQKEVDQYLEDLDQQFRTARPLRHTPWGNV